MSFSFRLFPIVGLLFLAFPLSIDSNIVFIFANKNFLFALSVGCDPSQGFYEKNILSSSKWDCKGYNF
jgi:hypothetical protein